MTDPDDCDVPCIDLENMTDDDIRQLDEALGSVETESEWED